jgi:glycine dehydrogenase subunit 1
MAFVPHSAAERAAMLDAIGAASLEDLFAGLPKAHLFPDLALPEGCSEMELAREMRDLAAGNLSLADRPSFLGAGAYSHFIPSAVDSILQRAEFFTAYTPYQPELSQGMLQAM